MGGNVICNKQFAELLLTSYSENKLSTQEADGVVLVWTVNNLLERPEFVFNCQSPVLTAKFPVFQPNIIVGGTYSGQLVLWDTRAKSTPVQRSPLSNVGHTHPIYCLDVVGTKNAHNLISISTDGTLCSWSLSNLSQPIVRISLFLFFPFFLYAASQFPFHLPPIPSFSQSSLEGLYFGNHVYFAHFQSSPVIFLLLFCPNFAVGFAWEGILIWFWIGTNKIRSPTSRRKKCQEFLTSSNKLSIRERTSESILYRNRRRCSLPRCPSR